MDSQGYPHSLQSLVMQLEILPRDAQQGDIADLDEVGRDIVSQLRQQGLHVEPFYTGNKSGSPIFDIVILDVWINQDKRPSNLAEGRPIK